MPHPASQTEIELKLQVPERARRAVAAAVGRGAATRTRLQAVYFDTPDRRLAAAGIAVRMRLEGTQWVQTAKAGDPHAMQRHEHNAAVAALPDGSAPPLDLSRHDGTRAGELVATALAVRGGGSAALQPLYRTDIERTHRVARVTGGHVELALDVGEIVSGDLRWPVHELEIELVSGDADIVVATARQWVERHGLWLDTRSKAERGDRLSHGSRQGVATRARPVQGRPDAVAREAWRGVLLAGLAHVLPNLGDVASGDHTPEHLRQLRIGLRRLCAAMTLFDGITAGPGDEVLPALDTARHDLGTSRDRDDIDAAWRTALVDAGAPAVPIAAAADDAGAQAVARRPALTDALLALQSWCLADGTLGPQAPDFRSDLCDRLRRWHGAVQRGAHRFDDLDVEQRHRLRRRIKRLRDALTQTAFLFRRNALHDLLKALDGAQTALGRAHDLTVAIAACTTAADTDPQAWFTAGWLTAQQPALDARAERAVGRLTVFAKGGKARKGDKARKNGKGFRPRAALRVR